ncbi:predicted protein [Chaetomium globosum CBS 148.51]|uniref:Uncharacterized protein n=1 Tax=Chaetomium globosum (strain ATCC 6205 / CBS 148.51 / DSM 1962 / NBRC 6347 / NRRL 1970) TaxID=306901 RepID=Q2H581_CHAGB|nr:uncharacterized protein CHGG_06184 [Chaetomium globosum CBS 148.51]EAQ89565.1 predicted protein [Chaetomium globosum CBS 148.51]
MADGNAFVGAAAALYLLCGLCLPKAELRFYIMILLVLGYNTATDFVSMRPISIYASSYSYQIPRA